MPYIGVSPQFGVRRKHTYTATAGQTSFSGAGSEGATLSYTDSNFVDVYQNGVKLGDADYTSTSGTAIVLAQGASVDDLVEIIVFDAFSAADTVSKADGGQFDGNVTMGGTLAVTGTTAFTGSVSGLDVNGTEIILDADADTSITSDTDDQIDFKCGGVDRVIIGADGSFTSQPASGGTIVFNEASNDVDFRVESNGNANMLFVDANNDRVGIGTDSPLFQLQNEGKSYFKDHVFIAGGLSKMFSSDSSNNPLIFGINEVEKARISSAGDVLIGRTSVLTDFGDGRTSLVLQGTGSQDYATIQIGNNGTASNTQILGILAFYDGTSNNARVQAQRADAADSADLLFSTRPNGGSLTERMRIISNGFVKHGNTGSYRGATNTFHEFVSSVNNVNLVIDSTNASLSADIVNIIATRASSGGNWVFLSCFSSNAADREFRIDSDGTTHADGSYSSSGGDYAEMFEWSDGNTSNEDRVGKTVVLEGNQIRLSNSDDARSSIIGVVSARPIVLGDAHSERWSEKFEKDVYGRYVFEEYTQTEWTEKDENGEKTLKNFQTDQIPSDETVPSDAIVTSTEDDGKTPLMRRKLNTDFDPSQTYIPREKRKEFSPIGLVGKLKVNVGQTIGDRWIKMREISDTVHEYLVR